MTEHQNLQQLNDVPFELKTALLALFEGDEVSAYRWLNQECPALGFQTPADTIKESPEGASRVHAVITRLEHGVHQ